LVSAFPEDLDRTVDDAHAALDAFFKGDPEPYKAIFSHGDDVTLANPFGPPVRGWSLVARTAEQAATLYSHGRAMGFDRVAGHATDELAYVVEIEHFEARIGDDQKMTRAALRVTTVFRREEGAWKVLHRHADAITSPRSAHSVKAG
jgi:ketosteroid isomerase-like protein